MALDISPALEQRLQAAAAARGISVDALLETLLDAALPPAASDDDGLPLDVFRQLAESVPTNTIIATLDGQLRYVNPAFCTALGYDCAQLREIGLFPLIHPDDRAATERNGVELRENGSMTAFVNRYITRNGDVRYFRWHATLNRQQGLVFAASRDITEERALQREAQERAAQITRILESVTDAFFRLDTEWRFVYLNSHAEDLLDRPIDELLGHSVWEAFAPAVNSTFYNQYKTAMQEQVTVSFTEYYAPLETWFEVRAYPSPTGLSVYFRDVTREKQQETQLRENEARLRGILDSQIDLVSRYLPDTTLTYVNDAYAAYFGETREKLLGRRFLDFEGAADADRIRQRLAEVTRDPSPAVRVLMHRDRAGNYRWIQWVDFGIQDATGRVVEIQAVGRDITEVYEARQQLQQQNEMLQTVFDHIPVIIALFDQDMRFSLVNQAWVDALGWTVEEMDAHPDIMRAFYPDDQIRQEAIDYIARAKPGWREFTTVTKDGSLVYAEWANVRLSDGRVIGIGRDVSARRALQQQRDYSEQLEHELQQERELMELKDRFAGTVSHEFRTPLAVILSSIGLIQRYRDRMSVDQMEAKLQGIAAQTQRMVAMLDDLLTITRSQSRQMQLRHNVIALAPFLTQVVRIIQQTTSSEHDFVIEVDEHRTEITADQSLLEHIFANLLGNAVKYSPPGSQVKIRTEAQPNETLIAVRDEGIGIPPADLPHLFEPFHRATNAAQINGTGLGLAIVKQYVDLHRGRILIETEVGKGTEFRVYLPVRMSQN